MWRAGCCIEARAVAKDEDGVAGDQARSCPGLEIMELRLDRIGPVWWRPVALCKEAL